MKPHTPVGSKREIKIDEHIALVQSMISNQRYMMNRTNEYIETIRHPSITFQMVIHCRDHVRKSLDGLEALLLVLNGMQKQEPRD